MSRLTIAIALLGLAAAGCGKSEAKLRQEVKDCSAISLDAPGISACLVAQFRWSAEKAAPAGVARQRELDSIAAFQRDSLWALDAPRHQKELASCTAAGGDVAGCLANTHGWEQQRALATADASWHRDAAKHRTEVRKCQQQRKSSVGACLILYYKWDSKRALALDDSLARARMKALNSR